jgi:hypothetical protein
VGLAALGGLLSEFVANGDWSLGVTVGIGIYLASYYLALFTWYRGLDRKAQGKVYTMGVGSYVLVFLFTWLLFFTLQTAGYSA